ncbi:uncharacterized protein LOC127004669 [Eriocheir sinensis]|uniref:uncharacterized protein LOC127004669 n=1 Tax=Eriocheir sinensis TaxID=95602 RepID=UPI0021CA2EF2|nr:uncharacterized protein LOC127004669 [Eriocheir sinensis]
MISNLLLPQVELLRRKTVDYFMFAVSTLMCGFTISVIVCLYCGIRSLTGEYLGIVSPFMRIVSFVICSTTLFHLCYSTHHFSQQVQRVSSQLRDLRVVAPGEENKAQLHYLIWTLESMETFDMGSWYHLNPNTLVSVTTFVLTYLVVLLQVGSYKIQGEPSAWANITTY